MGPKLYISQFSAPVRAVLMCAKAINLEMELIEINILEKEQFEPEYLKLNPLHTVPTMDDDGFVLNDSHVIMGYLVGKYAVDKSLYPQDLEQRAVIDQRLHFDSGVLFARASRMIAATLFYGATEVSEENVKAVSEAYDFVENYLQDNIYIAGNSLSIADFSILTSLTNSIVFLPVDEDHYPNISSWKKVMQALPYYDANEIGGEMFRCLIEKLLEK